MTMKKDILIPNSDVKENSREETRRKQSLESASEILNVINIQERSDVAHPRVEYRTVLSK